MSTVQIKLAPAHLMSKWLFGDQYSLAINHLSEYTVCSPFDIDLVGPAAAEEVFDLTNNPHRQTERERLYGRGRSVSVGDIVCVDDQSYLCAAFDWIELTT